MAGSINKVILIGHLGRDPEIRTFQNGSKVVNLRLATSESWRDKDSGERKERTEWHSVAIFNEAIGKIVLVKDTWTIDNGLMTPTMKVKRPQVEQKYCDLIRKEGETRGKVSWEA